MPGLWVGWGGDVPAKLNLHCCTGDKKPSSLSIKHMRMCWLFWIKYILMPLYLFSKKNKPQTICLPILSYYLAYIYIFRNLLRYSTISESTSQHGANSPLQNLCLCCRLQSLFDRNINTAIVSHMLITDLNSLICLYYLLITPAGNKQMEERCWSRNIYQKKHLLAVQFIKIGSFPLPRASEYRTILQFIKGTF